MVLLINVFGLEHHIPNTTCPENVELSIRTGVPSARQNYLQNIASKQILL